MRFEATGGEIKKLQGVLTILRASYSHQTLLPLEDDLMLAKSLVKQEKATDSPKDRAGDARKILGADEAASTRVAAADAYRKRKHLKATNRIEANTTQSLRIIFTNDCYDLQVL